MKRKFFLIMALVLPLMFVSCGDDDEPGSGINGTWEMAATDGIYQGALQFTFKGNSVTYYEYWLEDGKVDDSNTYKGTYSVDEENETITMDLHYYYPNGERDDTYPETWIFNYSLENRELTLWAVSRDARDFFGSSAYTFKKK